MKIKIKVKQVKKTLPGFIQKNKTDLSKTWEAIHSIVDVGRKIKSAPCS